MALNTSPSSSSLQVPATPRHGAAKAKLKKAVREAVSIPLVALKGSRGEMTESRYASSEDVMDDRLVPNTGSAARDFCALERTWLSNVRLCFLFILISVALMLRTRLPTPDTSPEQDEGQRLPMVESMTLGALYFVLTLALIAGGWWSYRDVRMGLEQHVGFVGNFKYMGAILLCVMALIVATAIALMVQAGSDISTGS
ncbi:hypothetical protein CALVIDRAFT_555932 [Calocera viscosa TUFC12733]|uniref:DUF202 domain-containing protein n=1 Tax=Calocera viscosa (strain TUFC12733) TaxID=1330018 RepID=A0A167L2M2_CALVF|nr:hypothetical protein CALVIDRAFT_555932 [Calocera viscosa TUFC12733]